MPYNSETETFYQAPATVVDSTPDGDTVQEGFDDRLTPAMAGLYADLNLLKADGMISVGIPATTTSRGIGRVATLADMEPGAEVTNGPAFLAAGSEAVTTTPTPNAVPQADASGKIDGWVSSDANKANVTLDNLSTAGKSKLFGVDQSWQDVTSSRALNVTYQNSSNRPILVSISYYYNVSAGELTFYINGVVHSRITGNRTYYSEPQFTEVTIPPGATYKIVVGGTPGAITSWREYA